MTAQINIASRPPRLFSSLRGYKIGWLSKDVLAGLAIAAVGLPSAIAYPGIAGLPPETGLYASMAPLVAYAIFGPSRKLIVGPDAATMTVLAAVLGTIVANVDPAAGISIASVAAGVAVAVGLLCLLARVMGLGVLATFLSRPILTGFFAGISVSIIVGQIGRFTGLKISGDGLLSPLLDLARQASAIHMPSLVLASAMLALLVGLKAARSPLPGPVVVVVIAVALSALLDFEGRGIAVVGAIPQGLPRLQVPPLFDLPLDQMLLGGLAVFLVSFGAGIITAKSFGALDQARVDPDRELEGFAAANLAAGLFGAFPVTSSDSRTAVNFSVGGHTQVAGIAAAAALMGTILFLAPALRILPIPALGAILVAAAASLIDVAGLQRLFRISRVEFLLAMIAFLGPISLGVLQGVMIAIGATLVYLLWKMMHPKDALLGLIPGREGFFKLHRTPQAQAVPGLGMGLLQGSLLFFNADHVRDRLAEIAAAQPPGTRWFVLEATAITQIDTTGAAAMAQVIDDFAAQGICFGLADLNADVRDMLERCEVLAGLQPGMVFDDMGDALTAFRRSTPAQPAADTAGSPDGSATQGGNPDGKEKA